MAITQADFETGASSDPPPSVTFNTAAAINDVLVCLIFNNEATSPGTITVSDNVNSGNYTLLNSHLDANSASGLFIYAKVVNTAGTPTVSVSESAVQYGHLDIARYTGFIGTPTFDATMNATGPFIGTGTAISCSPITTNFANELLISASARSSVGLTSITPSGWTPYDGSSYGSTMYYAVETTQGTTNNFVATLNASASWQNVFAGIYGASVGTSGPTGFRMPFAVAPLAWVIRRRIQRAREQNAELRRWKRDTSGLIVPEYKKVG
ncbi:MAG: hypothetical protein WBW84_19725 [Acidobacteriaceae bacterium]